MTNPFFDVRVSDPELRAEIELAAQVGQQASETSGTLTQDEVDRLLGIEPPAD